MILLSESNSAVSQPPSTTTRCTVTPNQVPVTRILLLLRSSIGQLTPGASGANGFFFSFSSVEQADAAPALLPPTGSQVSVCGLPELAGRARHLELQRHLGMQPVVLIRRRRAASRHRDRRRDDPGEQGVKAPDPVAHVVSLHRWD